MNRQSRDWIKVAVEHKHVYMRRDWPEDWKPRRHLVMSALLTGVPWRSGRPRPADLALLSLATLDEATINVGDKTFADVYERELDAIKKEMRRARERESVSEGTDGPG